MRQVNCHLKALHTQRMLFGSAPGTASISAAPVKAPPAVPAKGASTKAKGGERRPPATARNDPPVEGDKLTLQNATMGAVVTRFPPEASGFLHIGHAKAALIGRMLADKYQGKLIFRFDDTNPNKERHDFEDAIVEDLRAMGVGFEVGPTYSSDYMSVFVEKAEQLLAEGLAYCDTTPREELQKHRFDGTATACRDNSLEENMRLWREMLQGTEVGLTACLRAKISLTDPNKAMRDPVIFRCNLTPHARQGTRYKCYPTYDFCCPIVDSIEGVTHALRTNEYHDRNAQYYWFIEALGLRKPILEDFSRLNMEYTLMSKRKLTQLVEDGVVEGWDDPRMPTVRGLLRRGLTVDALRQFVRDQGMSKVVNLMQWTKLWNYNVQLLDPSVPRLSAVSATLRTRATITNPPEQGFSDEEKPFHRKNPSLGLKPHFKAATILLDAEDVALLSEGEEVTLMDWGNAFVRNIVAEGGSALPTSCSIELNPDGDVKSTKYKLTWVADVPTTVRAIAHEYDHILRKPKPEPEDELAAILAPCSKYTQGLVGEPAMAMLSRGQRFQIERRGYYIVDQVTPTLTLIAIPDGREKVNHLSAKYQYLKAHPPAPPAPKSKSGAK